MGDRPVIWTAGHSNHAFEEFAALLASETIAVVVDVRSYPYSRFASHFNREEMAAGLNATGVKYLYLGGELGGRPTSDDHYDAEGRALYGLMAEKPAFREAIERVLRGAADHRIALVCTEGTPKECHRRLLVGKVLTDHGAVLRHILPDGHVFEETAVEIDDTGDQPSLFGDEKEAAWTSTQSVSHRRRLSDSSVA
ncbi:MAG: DUF488 domain-containing protein [Thermoleophilaceae bacterium]|jgi:uncharacterized protein (DUF488 family)|nr:DUF488 domain-containing protein [Thermoleophilaceae bacterium]